MASKKLERKRSTQLELPNVKIAAKTTKPALWRIDSKVLCGKLMKELSVPSLDVDKVTNREWCLSPLVEDSEDKILSQVKIDDGDPSKSKHHDSKNNHSSSEVQLKQDYRNTLQLNSINDNELNVESDVEKSPSQSKSDSHDDRSPSHLQKHSNDDRNSPQSVNPHSSHDDRSPHKSVKSHSNEDSDFSQLKLDSNDNKEPSESVKPHYNDDRSSSQLKFDCNDNRDLSQSVKPHSNDNRSPPQLKFDSSDYGAPHFNNERSPSQSFRSYSSIEGQVCPITPAPDNRATSCDLPEVLLSTQQKKKFSFRRSRNPNYNHEYEYYSPSVLPPVKSPLLPRISNRNITSSPCGQRHGLLHRYDTTRSLYARKRHHKNSDSMCSLPEFHAERQHGVLERRMTRQKTGASLGHSIELLTTSDISPWLNSAMSSDG